MPSVSKKQKHLMDAVAHGWKMPGGKGPSRKVAKEFTRADKARQRKDKLNKWAHGDAKSNVGEYKT
jgi:hypothetical protein